MCFHIKTQKPTQSAGVIDTYWSYVYLSAIENDFRTVSWRVPIALRMKRALRPRFRFSICTACRTRYHILSLINCPRIFGIGVRFVIGFTNIIMYCVRNGDRGRVTGPTKPDDRYKTDPLTDGEHQLFSPSQAVHTAKSITRNHHEIPSKFRAANPAFSTPMRSLLLYRLSSINWQNRRSKTN